MAPTPVPPPPTFAARLGDPRAERHLYRAHEQRARLRVARMGVAAADVEEVAHVALTSALRRLPRSDGDAAFGPLLDDTCARLAARYRRRRARQPEQVPLEDAEPLVEPQPDPCARAAARETLRHVLALLARLSADKRQTLERHVLEGVSIHRIARAAFVTPSAIGRRLARARAELADMAARRDLAVRAPRPRRAAVEAPRPPALPSQRWASPSRSPRDERGEICPILVVAGRHGRPRLQPTRASRGRVDTATGAGHKHPHDHQRLDTMHPRLPLDDGGLRAGHAAGSRL